MKTYRTFITTVAFFLSLAFAHAQDVTITLTPVQQILPPQVLLYVSNPGKYFNVSVTNNTQTTQNIYMGLQLEQRFPDSGLSVSTPAIRQPRQPITIAPGITRQLTLVEIKTMFNHIPSNEISTTPGLFDNYLNGSFGLLPEGDYIAHLTAYKWDPSLANPVVLSNPNSGVCYFKVCYKAQAPQFLMPMVMGFDNLDVGRITKEDARFTWTETIINCNPQASQFRYDFVVKSLMLGQAPDDAMDRNPVVYRSRDLLVPMCVIPPNVINSFDKNTTYIAQVTAKAVGKNPLDYFMLENDGKSTYRMFRLQNLNEFSTISLMDNLPSQNPSVPVPGAIGGSTISTRTLNPGTGTNPLGNDDTDDRQKKDYGMGLYYGVQENVDPEADYTFRNPELIEPLFLDNAARKTFVGDDIKVTWKKAWFIGGPGERPDTVQFGYNLSLFKGEPNQDFKTIFEGVPLYTSNTKELEHTISWNDIKDKVMINDYLVLHVVPSTKSPSVAFVNDSVNAKDFAMSERYSQKFFQCSDMVQINNTTPTTKSAEELRGRTVGIGQYQLTLDAKDFNKVPGKNCFKGTGHIEWNPFGYTLMVAVKFDELYINTDNLVYKGEAVSYPDSKKNVSGMDQVDQLFSDWGIDNLIADTGIPYASQLQSSVTNGIKDIAKNYNIGQYYKWVKTGEDVWDQLQNGRIDDLHMPLKLPKKITKGSPITAQVVQMKFAPTHATMNLFGQFELPKNNYTDGILMLGAPRVCISPDRFLPEAGAIALLSNFNVKDPNNKDLIFTFKAPTNVTNPNDGCYVSWKADSLERMLVDLDIQVPGLKKCNANGDATKEKPIVHVRGDFADWEDFIAEGSMDPFEVNSLGGWTFKPGRVIYDNSKWRKSDNMPDMPKNYDWALAGFDKADIAKYPNLWKGLSISDTGVLFPKSLKFAGAKNEENGRMKIDVPRLIYDDSGITLDAELKNLLDAKTGKLGGWAFSIDQLYLHILQKKFKNSGFKGKFDVPILDGEIQYVCDISSQGKSSEDQTEGYDFTFKTEQVKDLALDFFLGTANFKKDQTFFEISGGTDKVTRVELCAGGNVTIAGTKQIDSKLPFGIKMPRVNFSKMRVSNFTVAESKLVKNIKAPSGTLLSINEEVGFKEEYSFQGTDGTKVYYGPGTWSLASLQKELGPFKFTLDEYGLKLGKNTDGYQEIGLNLHGNIDFCDAVKISAGAGLTIYGKVRLDNFSAAYSRVDWEKANFGAGFSFAGVELNGNLDIDVNRGGYKGKLHFKLPGKILEIDGEGGYYAHSSGGSGTIATSESNSDFKYGYFIAKVKGTGLHISPIVIKEVTGGFYFNCTAAKGQDGNPTPRRGLIGGVFGLGIATEGSDNLLNGNFDMTVVYDTKNKCLSTFLMNGTLNALSSGGDDGIIKAKATIAYQCLKDNSGQGGTTRTKDQYFSLDLSCDVKISPENVAKAVTTTIDQYIPLMNELEGNISAFTGTGKNSAGQWVGSASAGLNETMGTDSENNSFKGEKAPDNSENGSGANQKSKEVKASAGGVIALNFKVTKYENYQEFKKPKWHVYLGEPGDGTEASEEEKRCGIKIIDLRAKIVTVKIGANAYLCVGNELPNNGVLPPIPEDIRRFLNGGSAGEGVEQADEASVNRSREAAMEKFLKKAQNSGGVMFGYKAYGYIDVDLGLLYAYLGAVAGIDVSLVKINDFCNGKQMGIKGWYATGQAYAMLEAKMGIRIRLGFYNKDFDILHAQIGAMLKAGLPNPFWMVGQARVKLKLLGGLIKLNRSFKFECGSVCLPYLGSPLDNFELFTNCSVGGESRQEGWEDAEPITYENQIVVETSTELGTRLNLYDENFAQKLAFDRGGSNDDYKEYSNRSYTFNFAKVYTKRVPGERLNKDPEFTWEPVPGIELVEFSSPDKYARDSVKYGRDYISVISDGNRHRILLANSPLRSNRYYKLYLYGNAKEIRNGLEEDPYSMDTINGTYGNYPWSTMKVYYFRTGNLSQFSSTPEKGIQDDVALAFPSPDGHMVIDTLNSEPRIYTAYKVDISRPNIAFKRDISSKFNNNMLKWALYDETAKQYVSEDVANFKRSYVNENLNWLPDNKLIDESKLDMSHTYVIKLEYVRPKTAAEKKAEEEAKAAEEAAKAAEEAAQASSSSQPSGSGQSSGSSNKGSSSSGTHYFVHGGVVYQEGKVDNPIYEIQQGKKRKLANMLKNASTSSSESDSSGPSTLRRATTSSSNSSGSTTQKVSRKATTKYIPLLIQTPIIGNVNGSKKADDVKINGRVNNVGGKVVTQQPSIRPTTNAEAAQMNFSASVGRVLNPTNGNASAHIMHVNTNKTSVTVPGKESMVAPIKEVSTSSVMRPSATNISFNNPITNVEVKEVEGIVNHQFTNPIFSNKPSSTHIPKTKDEIIAEFFPNGRVTKDILEKMDLETLENIIKDKNVDRVRPELTLEADIEKLIEQEMAIAGNNSSGSSGSGGGGSSSSSSSQQEPWSWPEPTDQENKHVLLYGIRVQPSKVLNPVTEQVTQDPIISYSYPFMGDVNYGVVHKYDTSVKPSDYDLAFDKGSALVSIEGEGKKSIRLIDPYFYYNYLGGYANVSGWEARRYKYDDYPNLSTQGLVVTSKYNTVTPMLSKNPAYSYDLANNASKYRNYTDEADKRFESQSIGSFAAYVGSLPTSSIPSKSNFPNCTWLTDEGFSWVSPVRYTGFMAHYGTSQFFSDITRPYSELSSFVDALHRATRYFEDFFEDEGGLFNDIYRGCYINLSNCWFITNEREWKGAAFESYEHMFMQKEYNDSLYAFCVKQMNEHPLLFQQVESFLKEFFFKGYNNEEAWSDLEDFWKDVDKIYSSKTLNNGKWYFSYNSKEKDWKERLNKYKNPYVDLEQLHYNLLQLILNYNSFHDGIKNVYNTVYTKWNPDWDNLWKAYLRGQSSMYDDQYMFQMPFQQIPLMYASQYKGKNTNGRRTKLEDVLVGMSSSHPRSNCDEATTIWKRMADDNYEKFDWKNFKYVKGFTVGRHRANTFNFKKGVYEVDCYPGMEIFPESSKKMTIQLDR